MDLGRRLARRQGTGFRSPRRHLHAIHRGGSGGCVSPPSSNSERGIHSRASERSPRAHLRTRLGRAAPLLARWDHDRLLLGPRRHRERVADGRRRRPSPAPYLREGRLRPQPGVDTRRSLRRRPEGGRQAGGHPPRRAMALPPRGRRRDQARLLRRDEQLIGARLLEGGPVSLFLGPPAALQLHARSVAGLVADPALRPRHRREPAPHRRLRRRGAAGAVSRRPYADLHLAPRHRRRPGEPRPCFRSREGHRHRADPRRAGRLRPNGPLARLRLHARRRGHRLLEPRQAAPPRRCERAGRRDPVHGEGETVAGAAGGVAGEGRQRAGAGAHPALGEPIVRREMDRLRRLWAGMAAGAGERPPGGLTAAAHRGRRRAPVARIRSELLARRQVDRIRDVERRRGRARVEGAARRSAAAAQPRARPLRQPRVVAAGRSSLRHPGIGAGVPRPAARGRGLLRAGMDGCRRRRPARGDRGQARKRNALPSPGLLEPRRDAALLPRPHRGEEAHRRSEERPCLGAARRDGQAAPPAAPARRRPRPLSRRAVDRLHLA